MSDMAALAQLSHALDRVALVLAENDPDDGRIQRYLVELAAGQREAVAIALSYALRRHALEGPSAAVDRAANRLRAALRAMPGS